MPILHKVILLAAIASTSLAQTPSQPPKPGSPAPPLAFTRVFGASSGAKTNLPSLHGKVVVLEFWATWCSPCVADIPVLNSLAASLDPAKVQFISIDDEDPALVERFLSKHPISGWVGLDTTGKTLEAYGVLQRPTTIVIGPDGRVATTDAHPETLRRDQLLALAEGKPADFTSLTGSASPEAFAERKAILDEKFGVHVAPTSAGSVPVISFTPGDPGDGHAMMQSANQFDFTNFPLREMLQLGAGIRPTRLNINGTLPDKTYNLHVAAPTLSPAQLTQAVTKAISSATGLHIETKTFTTDCYVLQAGEGASQHATSWAYPGIAQYSKKSGHLVAVHATLDQLAAALENALGTPVVDETNLAGKLNLEAGLAPNDLAATNDLLAKEFSLKLVPAKRPITTYVVSAASTPAP